MTRKLSKQQWEFEIRRAMRVRESQRRKLRKAKFAVYERSVGRALPLSILLGLIAATALILLYGWREFFKFFLSWCVSLTLVATGAYYLWKHYEKAV